MKSKINKNDLEAELKARCFQSKFEKKKVEPLLLTDHEVAHILSVCRTSVWALVKNDRLHPIKLGMRMTRFSKDEVMKLVSEGVM